MGKGLFRSHKKFVQAARILRDHSTKSCGERSAAKPQPKRDLSTDYRYATDILYPRNRRNPWSKFLAGREQVAILQCRNPASRQKERALDSLPDSTSENSNH